MNLSQNKRNQFWLNRRYKRIDEYDSIRQRNHQFYLSTRWRKIRLVVLAENPLCQICNINSSEEVHHHHPLYTPVGWQNRLNYWVMDEDDTEIQNLIGLCSGCHSTITNKVERMAKKQQAINDRMNELNSY